MFQPTKDTKDSKDKAIGSVENAVSDFKSGKNELKRAGSQIKDAYGEVVAEAEGTITHLRTQAREVGEKVQTFIHDRSEKLKDVRGDAERTIRTHPLASTGAAFIGGLLLARLLRR